MGNKSYGSDWQPDEPTILESPTGVIYSFDSVEGWQSYGYKSTYLPAALEISKRVYVSSREDFLTLLAQWNEDENWSYHE